MPPSDKALPAFGDRQGAPRSEADTICPSLPKTGVAVIRKSGGHHFGGDDGHLAHVILDGWRRRMTME
jgi:type IV secretory pathway VirJ component